MGWKLAFEPLKNWELGSFVACKRARRWRWKMLTIDVKGVFIQGVRTQPGDSTGLPA